MSYVKDDRAKKFMDFSLDVEDRVNLLIESLSIDEKISLLPVRQAAVSRLGIKPYPIGGEAAHGVAWVGKATVFPQTVGLSCTWDRELMNRIGDVIGIEARAYKDILGEDFGLTLWAPTVDLVRDPRWGRTEEAYGEDPYLASELSGHLILGMQGDDPFYLKMGATLKHFFANNNEEDRGISSSEIHPWLMHNYYLRVFKDIIEKYRVTCIMTAYNSVNGIPCLIHPAVKKLVKDKWNLPGFVVTDAADFNMTVGMHAYFDSHAETLAHALKAGVDAFTEDEREIVISAAKEALDRGLISEKDIDTALKNVFKIRFRLGEFDPSDKNPYSHITGDMLCRDEHKELAYEAACKSIVLLKNNEILPLEPEKAHKIAVIGPLADDVKTDWYSGTLPYVISPLDAINSRFDNSEVVFAEGSSKIKIVSAATGAYLAASSLGQVSFADAAAVEPERLSWKWLDWGWDSHTFKSSYGKYLACSDEDKPIASAEQIRGWFVKEAFSLEKRFGSYYAIKTWNGKYLSCNGGSAEFADNAESMRELFYLEIEEDGIEKIRQISKEADVVVAFCGNDPFINGKETVDRPDIVLPPLQESMIRAAFAQNKNTILFLIGSYPFAINWEQDKLPAIVYSSHGGQELGNAAASALAGDFSPAGRLSMTWYRSAKDLTDIYDYQIDRSARTYWYADDNILYPFGHGLSYTSFRYHNLECSYVSESDNDFYVLLSFDISNVGTVESDEVVQCYLSCDDKSIRQIPKKLLRRFERVKLSPGETRRVEWKLNKDDFSVWNPVAEEFIPLPGDWKLLIGASSADIRLHTAINIAGEELPVWKDSMMILASFCDFFDDCSFVEGKDLYPAVMPVVNKSADIGFDKIVCTKSVERLMLVISNSGAAQNLTVIKNGEEIVYPSALIDTGKNWHEIELPLHMAKGTHSIRLLWAGKCKVHSIKLT